MKVSLGPMSIESIGQNVLVNILFEVAQQLLLAKVEWKNSLNEQAMSDGPL